MSHIDYIACPQCSHPVVVPDCYHSTPKQRQWCTNCGNHLICRNGGWRVVGAPKAIITTYHPKRRI